MRKSSDIHVLLSGRRNYDPERDPGKVYADVRHLVLVAFQDQTLFPTWQDVLRAGYDKLALALRRLDYHDSAVACGMRPDPTYWLDIENLRTEIERHFIDPQWRNVTDEESYEFEPVLPG